MHDAILLLQKGFRRILQSQFNPRDPGKGMEKLLDTGDNRLTLVKSTNAITAGSVIKKAKQNDKVLSILTGKTVLPIITTQVEAQEEANQLNIINQSVIGAKEGAVEAITKLVDSNITDAILRTADGSNHKSINNFTLFNVMQVAINGADRPSTNDVLEQLLEVINHTFNFCKKISVNMELLQLNAVQMATYGITIGIPQLVLMLLANIKTATKFKYGHEFRLVMHAIHKKYTYNHVHDAASLQTILTELAGADGVRVLKDTPAPSAGAAHSVADSVSFLHSMMDGGDTNSECTKSAYGATSTSELLEEEHKPRERDRDKDKQSKSCGKQEKKKKKNKTLMHLQRTPAPTAKKSNAGSPIVSTRTNACETKNTRDTISNLSATSSRWLSSHVTSLRRNWVGTQTKRIQRANDGARGQRMLRGGMIQTNGSKLNGRTVIRTK